MTCQFIFKVGLPQWRSYTFFNECSLCTLYSSKEIPIAAILLNAAIYILRHCWFSNRQKEAAALKIKATASKARENKIEKEGALLKFPLSKDYCALIFSTIDIRCNRFAGPLTAKREVNSTIAIMSIRGINGTLHAVPQIFVIRLT